MQIIILGNNTAALLSANVLASVFGQSADIHLVQSKRSLNKDNFKQQHPIATVMPAFADCLHLLKITEADFMQRCDAQFHLGTQLKAWGLNEQEFHHVYSDYGVKLGSVEFLASYLHLSEKQDLNKFDSYSLGVKMAQKGVFTHPHNKPKSILSTLHYSWRFSLEEFNTLLDERLSQQNITRHSSPLAHILSDSSGKISHIQLHNKQVLSGNLIINCDVQASISTPESSLQPKQKQFAYIRGLKQGSPAKPALNVSTREQNGWSTLSADSSKSVLTRYYLKQELTGANSGDQKDQFSQVYPDYQFQSCGLTALDLTPPRWRDKYLDLSALNADSIAFNTSTLDMLWYTLRTLCKMARHHINSPLIAEEFNRDVTQVVGKYNELTRLTLLPIISGTNDRLELYRNSGRILPEEGDQFPSTYYAALLYGIGITPSSIDPFTDQQTPEDLAKKFTQVFALIDTASKSMSNQPQYRTDYISKTKTK